MRLLAMFIGGVLAIAMLVGALWFWQNAERLALDMTRPEVALWAIRSGVVALIAGAQVVALAVVAERLYRRDVFGKIVSLFAGVVCTVALVSAVALGLAGR